MVVGHEIPEGFVDKYKNILFISTDLLAPDRSLPDFIHKHLLVDKGLKIVRGLQALQDQNIDYWFQLDSDDLIRDDFVEKMEQIQGKSGAIIQGGYFVYSNINRVIPNDQMVLYSGSTCILAAKHFTIPVSSELREEHMNCSPWGRYPHMTISDFFTEEVKESFVEFKEPMLGYVLANGDNISDVRRQSNTRKIKEVLKPYLKGQRFSDSLKQRFGILT